MLRVSPDLGETWEYGGRIAEDPAAHFSEPAIHRTPRGRLLALFRCRPVRRITNEVPQLRLALIISDDDGRTWSPWRLTSMRGYPGHLLGLRDGRIFATMGTRYAGYMGCTARVLDPEGSDLDTAPDFVIRADSSEADCGYPWSVELADGRVLVVYYYTHSDGTRGIEGTVIEEA
jgi:hypothetical protein